MFLGHRHMFCGGGIILCDKALRMFEWEASFSPSFVLCWSQFLMTFFCLLGASNVIRQLEKTEAF